MKTIYTVCVGQSYSELYTYTTEVAALSEGARLARKYSAEYEDDPKTLSENDKQAIEEWRELLEELGDRDDHKIQVIKSLLND